VADREHAQLCKSRGRRGADTRGPSRPGSRTDGLPAVLGSSRRDEEHLPRVVRDHEDPFRPETSRQDVGPHGHRPIGVGNQPKVGKLEPDPVPHHSVADAVVEEVAGH
jgi:hypothetical protein